MFIDVEQHKIKFMNTIHLKTIFVPFSQNLLCIPFGDTRITVYKNYKSLTNQPKEKCKGIFPIT